MIILCK